MCDCTGDFTVGYGQLFCYISNPKANLIFFGLPLALALLANLVLFFLSIRIIREATRASCKAQKTSNKQNGLDPSRQQSNQPNICKVHSKSAVQNRPIFKRNRSNSAAPIEDLRADEHRFGFHLDFRHHLVLPAQHVDGQHNLCVSLLNFQRTGGRHDFPGLHLQSPGAQSLQTALEGDEKGPSRQFESPTRRRRRRGQKESQKFRVDHFIDAVVCFGERREDVNFCLHRPLDVERQPAHQQ